MKFFKAITTVALFVSTSLAQGIQIGAPLPGSSVTAGSNFTVEVDRPDTLTGSREVAIVIALQSCPTNPCLAPADLLGSILYVGPYNPQFLNDSVSKPPHQNFSVVAPATLEKGRALLSVTHFALSGASPEPLFEIKNVTINLV